MELMDEWAYMNGLGGIKCLILGFRVRNSKLKLQYFVRAVVVRI